MFFFSLFLFIFSLPFITYKMMFHGSFYYVCLVFSCFIYHFIIYYNSSIEIISILLLYGDTHLISIGLDCRQVWWFDRYKNFLLCSLFIMFLVIKCAFRVYFSLFFIRFFFHLEACFICMWIYLFFLYSSLISNIGISQWFVLYIASTLYQKL